jgi:hypothetical protein
MKLAILCLSLCVGIMAYGQSAASGSASSGKQWKGPSSTDFDNPPLRWQVGTTSPARIFPSPNTSFFWQEEQAQGDSKLNFQVPQLGARTAFENQLLAQNVLSLAPEHSQSVAES